MIEASEFGGRTSWRVAVARATALPTIGVVAIVWGLVCVTFAAQRVATGSGSDAGLATALASIVLFNAVWLVLTLPLLASVWGYPPASKRIIGFALLHLSLCAVVAVLHLGLFWWASAAFGVLEERQFSTLLTKAAPTNIILYWIVVGIALGIDQRRRIRQRTAAANALEASLSDAKAAMLRAQLRPHFLFNTLNTISALIRDEPATAERMVARLGDLLRLSLDDTRGAQVSLATDLATVDAYLAIEKLRLGNRLRVVRDIAPETLPALVPDLLLQPLIENAIEHGIAPTTDGGTLEITARRHGNLLKLIVADDGVGGELANIEQGVGLRSVRDRVIDQFIDNVPGDMSISSSPGQGFKVELLLPWAIA